MQTRLGAVKVLQISALLHQELERLMVTYITYVLEQRLQSVEFLKRLRREDAERSSALRGITAFDGVSSVAASTAAAHCVIMRRSTKYPMPTQLTN